MTIDLVCLGVGKGASYVTKGITSTGFAILINDEPQYLVDAGAGIVLSCKRHLNGVIPNSIFITHNHMDHTGDLPILLSMLDDTICKPRIYGHPDVLEMVKQHRLHDPMINVDVVAEWITPDTNGLVDIGNDISLSLIKTKHSYLCYGFVMFYKNQNVFGYTADTPYDQDLFKQITQSPIAVIDARDKATYDHPSFEEVQQFAKQVPNCTIWVVHYEETKFIFTEPNINLMYEGQTIRIVK